MRLAQSVYQQVYSVPNGLHVSRGIGSVHLVYSEGENPTILNIYHRF